MKNNNKNKRTLQNDELPKYKVRNNTIKARQSIHFRKTRPLSYAKIIKKTYKLKNTVSLSTDIPPVNIPKNNEDSKNDNWRYF